MRSLFILVVLATASLAIVIPRARNSVVECLMCEKAVKAAAPELERDTEAIEKDFDEDCVKDLKIPFAGKECEKYINMYLDIIINELKSGTAPKDVCKKLHDC
ncbi:hypothetical protein V3C99_014211 [Haemonchus contortus]